METDRPGRRRPAGSWLFLDSESRRQRNHEPRQPEIPKRKKSDIHTRLSCKIDYLLRSNHNDQSIASEFFTGDSLLAFAPWNAHAILSLRSWCIHGGRAS